MNVFDYIKWRGEIPFRMSPYNEVDSLIISQIPYLDFSGVLPYEGNMLLREAVQQVNKKDLSALTEVQRNRVDLISKASECERFRYLEISDYIKIVSEENQEQFCAITIHLPYRIDYVAFEGTDSSLIGWKENFNMTLMKEIPSQQEAARYLKKVTERKMNRIIVGGHSKGGNLAIYAAAKNDRKDKIIAVNNFDGPGFNEEFLASQEYLDIKDKITCYLPQTSVIGRLLNSNSDYEVIHSDSPTVVMQHDVMTWQIDVTQIERVQETTEESRYLQQVFAQWNNKLSYEDKYVFLNTMYDILTESGITSANPVFADKTLMIRKMLAAYPSLNEETKGIFLYVMSTLFKTNVQAFQDVYLNKYLRRLRKEKKSNEDTGNQ